MADNDMNRSQDSSVAVSSGEKTKLAPPDNYKVLILNDDYTTKEFVVYILMKVFHKSPGDAVVIMESVHKTGKGVAGVYTYDIAVTKANQTMNLARKESFPLSCTIEKV